MTALVAPLSEALVGVGQRAKGNFESARDVNDLLIAYSFLAADLVSHLAPEAELLRLYLQERHGPATAIRAPVHALATQVRQMTLDLTELVQKQGFIKANAEVNAIIVLGAVHELIADFLHGRLSTPLDQLAPQMLDMLLNGVRK